MGQVSRLPADAAREVTGPVPTEEESIDPVETAREAFYRERESVQDA